MLFSIINKYKWSIILLVVVLYYLVKPNQEVDFAKETPNSIHFHKGDWQSALDLAKRENKLIFLDIYATWCGPCKKLKTKTFSDIKAGSFYNKSFINVAIDGEKGDGPILMQKYQLNSFPSLLFINADGEVILQDGGYKSIDELIDLGKSVLD